MAEVTAETAHRMEDVDKAPLHGNLESLTENFMLAAVVLFVSINTSRDMVMAVPVVALREVLKGQSLQRQLTRAAVVVPYTKIVQPKQAAAVVPVS